MPVIMVANRAWVSERPLNPILSADQASENS